MQAKFKQFPQVLQKQILIRITAGFIALLMLIIIFAYRGGLQLMFPCIGFSATFFTSALLLYIRCDEGRYVVIQGICTEIDKTGIRRKVKDIYIKGDQFTIRIARPTMKLRNLNVGDRITIYLTDNTPVYEMDGCKVVCNTLAVEKEF